MPIPGITFVIFHRYTTDTPITVAERVRAGMASINELHFEIFLVQDGGLRKPEISNYILGHDLKLLVKEVHYSVPSGIAYAMLKGIEHAKYSHACVVPGNDQYTSESFALITINAQKHDAVLGFRHNLFAERPLPKIFASKILLYGTKFLFFPKAFGIKDFHGLTLYKVSIINKYLIGNEGHGIQISLILPLLYDQKSVLQTRVFLNHKESSFRHRLKFPKPRDIFKLLDCLLRLFFKLRLKTLFKI